MRFGREPALLMEPRPLSNRRGVLALDGRGAAKTQRVSPWWKELPDGSVIMTLRVGFSAVEIEKGKAGIAAPSRDKVPDVIETLLAAVRAGELDQMIAAQAQAKPTKKQHRAA